MIASFHRLIWAQVKMGLECFGKVIFWFQSFEVLSRERLASSAFVPPLFILRRAAFVEEEPSRVPVPVYQ